MTETAPATSGQTTVVADEALEPDIPWLLEPRDGVPELVSDAGSLKRLVAEFSAGTGPVALDAERASGYRYSQRAYLIQLRRAGPGTALIDPIACPDLQPLGAAIQDTEWVLHAAGQDLRCLAEVGLIPNRLFDTELAGRLLGYPRVALGIMLEQLIGVRLEKGHSAADWSNRPLPQSWLTYAALDVELLLPLREKLTILLEEAGKTQWAHQEFEAVRLAALQPPVARPEPWRRISGIHRLRRPRQLAGARALWEIRDGIAADTDIAPGRILPDSAIVAAVQAAPADETALRQLPVFTGARQRRRSRIWWNALASAAALTDDDLPRMTGPGNGDAIPQAARWADRDPAAAQRLARVRAALETIATERVVPVTNLLEPALSRRLAWDPPADMETALREGGARPWQIELTSHALEVAVRDI